VPADCEIAECRRSGKAVQAAGVCTAGCQRPMCSSHSAAPRRCVECQAKVDRELQGRAQQEQDHARNEAARALAARRTILRLVRLLVAAGVRPTEKIHHETIRVETGTFRRRYELREVPSKHRYGWFVGEHSWSVTNFYGDTAREETIETYRTYVTVDGRLAAASSPSGTDDAMHRYISYEVEIDGDKLNWSNSYNHPLAKINHASLWEDAAAVLAAAAREHGIEDPGDQ
jgi:hypothetical protein